MPTSHSIAKSGATCLACIPVRMGVFIASVMTIVGSIGTIYLKKNFTVQSRMIFGGYGGLTTLFGKYIDYIGVVWGLWGIIGCWQMKQEFLKIYNYYQILRASFYLYILYADFPLIWNCEEWALDLDNAAKKHGWNPVMYAVGSGGQCVPTRFYFNVFISLGVALYLYLIWVNIQLQNLIDREPAYLLRLHGHKMDPAYYAYSLGERSALLAHETDPRGQRRDLPKTRDRPPYSPNKYVPHQTLTPAGGKAQAQEKADAMAPSGLEPLWDVEEGKKPTGLSGGQKTVSNK